MSDESKRMLRAIGRRGGGGAALVLAVFAATALNAAPAPPYKGLPEEVEALLGMYTRAMDEANYCERRARRARTAAERDGAIQSMEKSRWDSYCLPVVVLELALRDPRYRGWGEQLAIRRALEKYRLRQNDAKMKGLFKPKPPPAAKAR